MKKTSQNHRHWTIIVILFPLFFALGCFTLTPPKKDLEIAKSFQKSKYDTIGLLVVRVGCQDPQGVGDVLPTLKTDYSKRVPASVEYGLDGLVSKPPRAVYIEDADRLTKSFPHYPRTTEKPMYKAMSSYSYEFFGNLTPQIYETVRLVLEKKGYAVIDIKKASAAWQKPVSESTVEGILSQAQPQVDALLLVQYMDIGDTTAKEGSAVLSNSYSLVRKGLSDIEYNVSLFDCATKECVISYRLDYFPALLFAVENDPDEKPRLVENAGAAAESYYETTSKEGMKKKVFTNIDIVALLMKYIQKGSKPHSNGVLGTSQWRGIEEIIP